VAHAAPRRLTTDALVIRTIAAITATAMLSRTAE
jgi:hypothetical protein